MLPRSHRLQEKRIKYILKKGNKYSNNFFTIKYLPSTQSFSCFCVIVSAKTEPKAVKRNQLRRRIYEIFRLYGSKISPNYDVVFIAKEPLAEKPYKEIVQHLLPFFHNLKYLK